MLQGERKMHDKVQNIKTKIQKTFQVTCDESGHLKQNSPTPSFQLTDMASSTNLLHNLLQCRQEIQTR